MLQLPPLGYRPRPASDPHVGKRYKITRAEKARLDALGVIDLLPNAPPDRFQYSVGSCTGQGFGHALDYVMRRAAAAGLLGFEPFSPSSLAIYAYERAHAGTFMEDLGATLADGVYVLKTRGIPREVDWPYDETRVFEMPPLEVNENAVKHRLVNARPLVHDADDLRHALATDCPVLAGVPCYDTFFDDRARSTGFVADPPDGAAIRGWHCVAFYKHDPFARRWYFKNWWPDWGDACVGSVSDDYLMRRSNELYAIGAVR